MLTYNELKEKYKDRRIDRETYGPSKDDLLYQKYLESKPKATGGTANPIFSTNPKVKENKNLTGRETKTYAEHLQESQNRAAALAAQARPTGETPSMQAIKEMIFGRKEGGTINPTFSAADFNSRYDKMQERERAAYNYFRSTGREKEAADYLKAIEPEINRRAAERRTADAKKLAEESTMGGLYARYMANLTSPLGAIYGAVQEARGEAIDPNSPLFWGQQTQEGQTEGFLGESTGGKRLLKEAALGAFDWGTQVATLGALGVKAQAMGGANSALYGTSAFAGNVKDATERGATGEEAIFYGAIGAAAEIVTEKIGFDRLFELGKLAKIRGGKKGLVKEILKNIGSEGLEEGSTEVANLLADTAILGDRSQLAEIYQAAQAQGMTETEAIGEALKAAAGQIGHSAAVGGISGGMIAGGVAGLSGGLGRNMLDYTDEQKEEIKRRQAEKEAARNKDTTVETVGEAVENGGKLPENVNEPPKTVTGQAENVTEPQKTVTGQAEIEGFGEEYYGGKGKAAFIRLAQEKGTLDFTPAFNTYYRAGIAGITESEIRQTAYTAAAEKLMLNEAYMAGAEDRKAEIANAIRGRNKLSGKRGLILGEDVKATEGQLAIAKLYADIGGVRIRLVDQIDSPVEGAKVNGYQEGDTITIALNADSFMGTMHHEMVHYIRKVNPAAYDSMRELVFNLANKSGIDMDAQMDEYRTVYMDTYGEDADMMVFMEEVVADAFQKITGDQTSFANFINDLRKTEPTLLEKIKEFLDQMVEFLESLLKDNTYTEFAEELSKDKENLKKLRKEFARALTETGKMEGGTQEAQSDDVKFSKKLGGYFPNTKISTETVKAIGIKNINNVGEVIDKVCNHLKNDFLSIGEDAKPIENIDTGMQIYIYRKGINETFGKKEFYENLSDEWKKIKIAVALELDEIIKYGEVRANEAENIHNPNSDTTFAYLTAPVTVDGKKVTVDIDIRRTNRGDRFYMHKIKVADSSSRAAVKRPKFRAELSASGESITQRKGKDNRKFSLKQPMEETKDLIAIHNISEGKLKRTLELGGFPMPSIAITREEMKHSKFGEISIIFPKDTIDPADKRNKVFSADAWTPTFPRIEYEVDEKSREALRKRMNKLEIPDYYKGRVMGVISSLEDSLRINGGEAGLIEDAIENRSLQAAYLAEQGRKIEIEQREKKVTFSEERTELYERIIQAYEGDFSETLKMSGKQFLEKFGEDKLKNLYLQYRKEKGATAEQQENIANFDGKKIYRLISGVFTYQKERMKTEKEYEPDYYATDDKIKGLVDQEEYREWLVDLFDGIVKEEGVYNGKEYFTPSGNRRSFSQTHFAVTLENIVKAMKLETKNGKNSGGFSGISTLRAATSETFKSIDEIRKGKERIREEESIDLMRQEAEKQLADVMDRILESKKGGYGNRYIALDTIGELLQEEAGRKYSSESIQKQMTKYGYEVSDGLAQETKELLDEIKELPVLYFEAKPERVVDFAEAAAIIIPDTLDGDIKKELGKRFDTLLEYKDGNDADRAEKVNSLNGVKFSIRKESIEADIAGNEHWKAAYEGILKEFEVTKEPLKDRESAKKAARKFLKNIKSYYDVDEFTERFVRLCHYGADMQSDGDYKDLLAACTMLAEDALQKSEQRNTELYDRYADLRKQMRGYTLHIGKDTLKELEAMGINYNELRMENFGRVRISQKSGEKIDTKYAELAEAYPELFKMEQSTSQGELLMDMIAVRESLDPTIENPYFDNLQEYAAASAYELLGMMNEVALEKQTFADKYEERLQKLREENKQSLKNIREQAKNEKKLLQQKYATNAEARIEAVKQKYEKRLDRKEYWRLRKLAVKDAKALAEWLKSPTDKNHVPKKFKESVETVLALIETEKPDLQIPLKSFVAMKGGLMELYGDTQGIYLYVEQDDQVINILDRFIQKYPEGANIDAMDGTDMKYFRNLIASVKKACTDANKLHTSQREKTAVSVSEEFINASQKKKDAKETGMIRRIQDFLGMEMLDANSFFKRIGGAVYSELWKGLRKGMDKKISRWKEAMDFINALVDPKDVRKWTEEAAKEFEIGGVKVYLTIPQIMSLACLMRRSQGRQHIIGQDIPTENGILRIRGGGFKAEPLGKDKKAKLEKAKVVEPTEADIKEIIGTLTEEQARVAYEIQRYLSTEAAAWGNETSMLLFGYEKFTTKNYFPIVSDQNFVNQPVTKTEDIAPSLRSMGITKNVNQYANNPVIIQDIFKVFANHVDQMGNYNAFVASESDFNKFMNYKVKAEDGGRIYSVKDEMDRTMGTGGVKYIKTLMNRLVTATGLSDDSDFAKMFVRNMKVASVGANLRVIVQQPTAYLRAANQISLKYLLHPAVFRKTDKKIIYQYAPIALWKSWGNYEMNTGKSMYEQIIAPTKFAQTKDLLMKGAGIADEWTWIRLWNACVLEARDKHPDLSKEEIYTMAGEKFGDVVDESQVVDSILHRSQIMRKKGLYTQMATSFMSEPMKTFNMASNALVELVRDNTPENRKKFIRCYMTVIASGIATACAAGLVDAMRDDDDDESFFEKWKKAVAGDYSEAETPKDFAMTILSNNIADNLNPMGMIPYLRDAWSVLQGYDIKRTDFDWLNDILKSMKRWKDFMAGESEYTLASMMLNTAGAVSKLTGIPLGSAERDMKALGNLIVLHIIGNDEMKYDYRKLSKDIGSEKNVSYYVERMLRAKFSGNEGIATKIYNDMIHAGISNEKIDKKIESKEKKALKEEPTILQAAEAYANGDISGYMEAFDRLREKGYADGNISKAIASAYNKLEGGEEEEETFETITSDYWKRENEPDFADYEMLFNAYMAGNEQDYDQLWELLEADGKEKANIKKSMKDRLEKAYHKAEKEGDYQKAQRAAAEFMRLGGKRKTLEKENG